MQSQRYNLPLATNKTFNTSIFIGVLLLSGCSHTNESLNNTSASFSLEKMPNWVYETSKNGKVGGVGISKPHYAGKTAQRTLAISRALDEIARQMGVKVVSSQKISTTGTSQNATTSLESYSFQTTDGKVVRATIQAFWEDKPNEELYVWMLTE